MKMKLMNVILTHVAMATALIKSTSTLAAVCQAIVESTVSII